MLAVGIQGRILTKQCSDNASLLLTHALGQRVGKGARWDLAGRVTPGRISCRSKATSTTEMRSLLQHSSGCQGDSTLQG